MAGIIRIILIVVIIYYLVRFLDKYVAPYLFGKSGKDNISKNNKDDENFTDYEEVE